MSTSASRCSDFFFLPNKMIITGKIVNAQTREYSVSITVVTPNDRSTGKLINRKVENPIITVRPDTVIACPTLDKDTVIASFVDNPFDFSSRYLSMIRIVNSVPMPNTRQLSAIVSGL